MDPRRVPRCRGVLRHQRVPDHAAADRGVLPLVAHLAGQLLDAPGPPAAPGAVPPARRRVRRGAPVLPRRGGQPGGAGLVGALVRHQLVLHLLRAVVLRPGRTSARVPAPVVAGDRGAVLPRVAARPAWPAQGARPQPPSHGRRHLRRRRAVDDLDGDPVPAGRRSQPGLLRHRHPCVGAAARRRPRPALATERVVGQRRRAQAQHAGGRRRGRRRRAGDLLPADGGVQLLPLPRRLLPRRHRLAGGDHVGRPPGDGARPAPVVQPGAGVDRRALVLAVPVALADLRVHPARSRSAARVVPDAGAAPGPDRRRRRAELPVRRGADPQRCLPAVASAPGHPPGGSPAHGPDRRSPVPRSCCWSP